MESLAAAGPGVLWLRLADGRVFSSSDGGSTWSNRTPTSAWVGTATGGSGPLPGPQPETVTASDAQMARLLPDGAMRAVSVATTIDRGRSWTVTSLPKLFSPGGGAATTSFVTPRDGWVSVEPFAGPGYAHVDLFHTVNGGKSWQLEAVVRHAGGPVELVDAQLGFVGGNPAQDSLAQTTDGGTTWSAAALPVPPGMPVQQIPAGEVPTFTNAQDGFLYTNFEKAPGQGPLVPFMDQTTNGGKTWTQIRLPATGEGPFGWPAWSIVSPTDWYLIGPHAVLHTTDGGATWTTTTPRQTLTNVHLAVFFPDNTGIALIDRNACADRSAASPPPCHPTAGLVRTWNGGRSWSPLTTPSR